MNVDTLTDWAEVERILKGPSSASTLDIDPVKMTALLKAEIKGQDHVIDDLVRTLRFRWGMEMRGEPVANFVFVGPPATGKTALAKALAGALFQDAKALLEFKCTELSRAEDKSQLIGVPVGYEGAEKGGKLTQAMFSDKRRVILFDEADRAHPLVRDLLLQIMGEGELTELASGRKADFTQAVIILTTNLEYEQMAKLAAGTPTTFNRSAKALLTGPLPKFDAAIVSRIHRVYDFHALEGMDIARIAALVMARSADRYRLKLTYVDPKAIHEAMKKGNELGKADVRDIGATVADELGDQLLAARQAGLEYVCITVQEDGTFSVEPGVPLPDAQAQEKNHEPRS